MWRRARSREPCRSPQRGRRQVASMPRDTTRHYSEVPFNAASTSSEVRSMSSVECAVIGVPCPLLRRTSPIPKSVQTAL